MADIKMSDIVALGEKLESVGLTDDEKALLGAAMDITAKAIAEGAEVEGYSFATESATRFQLNTAPQQGTLARGFESSFKALSGGQFNPAATVVVLGWATGGV